MRISKKYNFHIGDIAEASEVNYVFDQLYTLVGYVSSCGGFSASMYGLLNSANLSANVTFGLRQIGPFVRNTSHIAMDNVNMGVANGVGGTTFTVSVLGGIGFASSGAYDMLYEKTAVLTLPLLAGNNFGLTADYTPSIVADVLLSLYAINNAGELELGIGRTRRHHRMTAADICVTSCCEIDNLYVSEAIATTGLSMRRIAEYYADWAVTNSGFINFSFAKNITNERSTQEIEERYTGAGITDWTATVNGAHTFYLSQQYSPWSDVHPDITFERTINDKYYAFIEAQIGKANNPVAADVTLLLSDLRYYSFYQEMKASITNGQSSSKLYGVYAVSNFIKASGILYDNAATHLAITIAGRVKLQCFPPWYKGK